MRIKICGLTRFSDCELALSLGATELGFIFTESPRRISVTQGQEILNKLPPDTTTIGVFRNAEMEVLLSVLDELPLKGVQLHGSETPAYVSELLRRRPGLMIIKVIPENDGVHLLPPEDYLMAHALLFDHGGSHQNPGSRRPLASLIPQEIRERITSFIAGNINEKNVLGLIRTHHPDGIDLSSGVEASPGIKDAGRMKTFFTTLKENL